MINKYVWNDRVHLISQEPRGGGAILQTPARYSPFLSGAPLYRQHLGQHPQQQAATQGLLNEGEMEGGKERRRGRRRRRRRRRGRGEEGRERGREGGSARARHINLVESRFKFS